MGCGWGSSIRGRSIRVLVAQLFILVAVGAVGPQAHTAEVSSVPKPWSRPLNIPPVVRGTPCIVGEPDDVCQARKTRIDSSISTERRITIPMKEAGVQILDGAKTKMWTFGGTFPGPTIRVPSGTPLKVNFINQLPASAGSFSIHNHGGHSPSSEDGQPEHHLIPPGGSREYNYPLIEGGDPERAAFQWYHDHRMDVTARNVWRGLAGMFIIDDEFEQNLPLPKGEFDIPLMLTDRSFTGTNAKFCLGSDCNQLTDPYPGGRPQEPPNDVVLGDHVLVNGGLKPFLDVGARQYRIRLLNASSFRSYELKFVRSNYEPVVSGLEMYKECHTTPNNYTHPEACRRYAMDAQQISTESGLVPEPAHTRGMRLMPAERAEFVVDFSDGARTLHGSPYAYVTLSDYAQDPPEPLLLFKVFKDLRPKNGKDDWLDDSSSVPSKLRPLPPLPPPQGPVRKWKFSGPQTDPVTKRKVWTINGKAFDPERVDAFITANTPEVWELQGHIVEHVVHIHGADFRVLSMNGKGPPGPLKESIALGQNEVVRVAIEFRDHLGPFIMHCHMLEHEDNGLMAQFYVRSWFDGVSPPASESGLISPHALNALLAPTAIVPPPDCGPVRCAPP